ncbi:MAG: hypothetical protein HQL88_00600 [Magnetococcales bacterium]|nr:hypothetical protein [Magnetococcales bacterium]
MEFMHYTPAHHDLLLRKRDHPLFPPALSHRGFVDWYYGSPWCHLYLFLERGELAGMIGIDHLDFLYEGRPIAVAAANNHVAFLPGMGGVQFLYWLKAAPYTLVFGGSPDTHALLRQNGWHYFPPIPLLLANRGRPGGPITWKWRPLARGLLSMLMPTVRLARRRAAIIRQSGCALSVREERLFTADMLPVSTPFCFRFAPTLEYLQWRYATSLSFIRYRLFRILRGEETVGYVVLKESPNQLLVSQCDGIDAVLLACGVLLALAEVTEQAPVVREMCLCSSHPPMQRLFRLFGFHEGRHRRPFVMGSGRRPLEIADDTQEWLVNFDWNDNGLRPPFLDE